MKPIGLIVFLALMAATASPSHANNVYADAQVALEREDYATVWQLIRPLADKGDPLAEMNVGVMYEKGHGVPQDYGQAVAWYRKAADQGYAPAQTNLAVMYHNGRGVSLDDTEAAKWVQKAADQGYVRAELILSANYKDGEGVPRDFGKEAYWLQKAADQGSALAQGALAALYVEGRGVQQDDVQALKWRLLEERSPEIGDADRDRVKQTAERLSTKMTAAQVEQANQLAREWKQQ